MNDMADRGSVGLLLKNFNLFRLEIWSATQATRNEDNWSTAEHDDNFKTPNEKKLSSSWCVILHLQHCLEEKTRNFTRVCVCVYAGWPFEVLWSWSCSSGHNFLQLKMFIKKQNCLVENSHQEEESFFSFGVLKLSSCSAVDQLSSFRVACVADRISSRNKLKCLKSKPTDPRSAMSFMCNLSGV